MSAPAPTRQPAAAFRCPVCGEDVPARYYWEPTLAPPGRRPAWRLRHRRQRGGWCTLWAGEAVEAGARLDSVA